MNAGKAHNPAGLCAPQTKKQAFRHHHPHGWNNVPYNFYPKMSCLKLYDKQENKNRTKVTIRFEFPKAARTFFTNPWGKTRILRQQAAFSRTFVTAS